MDIESILRNIKDKTIVKVRINGIMEGTLEGQFYMNLDGSFQVTSGNTAIDWSLCCGSYCVTSIIVNKDDAPIINIYVVGQD